MIILCSLNTSTVFVKCTQLFRLCLIVQIAGMFNMDRKMFNLVVLLDLKKVFDTIDHSILLSKLEPYGITGNALSMIRSYLSGRNKKCQLGDKMSTARRIECGIPHGSILGPLFFLIYDLPQCLNHATAWPKSRDYKEGPLLSKKRKVLSS